MNADERLQKCDEDVMALTASKTLKTKKSESKHLKSYSKTSEDHKSTRKFSGKCHYCQKTGHRKADCFLLKKKEHTTKPEEEKKQGVTFMCNSDANLVEDQQEWVVDSGVSFHMAFNRKMFWSIEEIDTDDKISMADERRLSIKGIGQIKIETWVNGQ